MNWLAKTESSEVPTVQITPMEMLEIAVKNDAPLEKLEKLMDLQERWEANEARKAFVVAMTRFKANAPQLFKDKHVSFVSQRTNKTTEYDHATLDQVCSVVGKALSVNGISHSWNVEQFDNAGIKVTCILTHEKGHSESVPMQTMPDDSGGKNNIQAIGSAVTYLQRYTLLAATGLATQDQDNDGANTKFVISDEQKQDIIDLMRSSGADGVKFLKYMGVASVDEIPASQYHKAITALEAKVKQ